MPLFLFHLLEFMDVEYELDIDEINARWGARLRRGRGLGSGDNRRNLAGLRDLHCRTQHRCVPPRRSGACLFARAATDWETVADETEAFFMRVAAPGDLRCEGAQLGVLVTRGHLQTDDYQLTERCRRWVAGIKAKFISTPWRRPTPLFHASSHERGVLSPSPRARSAVNRCRPGRHLAE